MTPSTAQTKHRWLWILPGVFVFTLAVYPLFRWGVLDATWLGTTAQDCLIGEERKPGACWPAVSQNLPLLLGGRYPQDSLWRPGGVVLLGFASLLAPWLLSLSGFKNGVFPRRKGTSKLLLLGLPLFLFPLQILLMAGFQGGENFGLAPVPTELWGGFALTWILASGSILCSLVPGLLLALMRQAENKILSTLATSFIELVRGIPLITILFVGHFLFPLFLPSGKMSLGEITRATLALSAFLSAYCAEVWRGGLLAVPKSQHEAAHALGLTRTQSLVAVVFPQATRVALPGLVATFVGLFKDTSLVAIIGLFDLLGMARAVPRSPAWLGFDIEPLVFAGLLFAGTSFLLASVGRILESNWRT